MYWCGQWPARSSKKRNEINENVPTAGSKQPIGNPSVLIGGVPRLTLYGEAR